MVSLNSIWYVLCEEKRGECLTRLLVTYYYLLLAVASYISVHHALGDRFDALWSAQVQPDGSSLRLEDQREREKGAAPSLKGDELPERVRPAVIFGKAEGIPTGQFVHLLYILEEIVDLFVSPRLL